VLATLVGRVPIELSVGRLRSVSVMESTEACLYRAGIGSVGAKRPVIRSETPCQPCFQYREYS